MLRILGVRYTGDGSNPAESETILFTVSPDGGDYKELAKLALEGAQYFEGAIAVDRGIFFNVYDPFIERYSIMFVDMTTGEQSVLDLGLSDDEGLSPVSTGSSKYRYMGDEYISFVAVDRGNGGNRVIDLNTNTLQSSSQYFPFTGGYFSRNLVVAGDIYSRSDYSEPFAYTARNWKGIRIGEPDIPDGSFKFAYFNNAEAGSELGLWLADDRVYDFSLDILIPEQWYFSGAIRENYAASSDLSRFFAMGYSGFGGGRTWTHLFVSVSGEILREVELPASSLVSPLEYNVHTEFFFSEDGRYAVIRDTDTGCVYSVLDNGAHYDLSEALPRIDRDSMWILLGSSNDFSGGKKRPVFWTELKNTAEVL